MTDIDFYVDALLAEKVMSLGPGARADEVEDIFGTGYLDDARKQWMRRDYGLLEFQFNRAVKNWVCFGVSIQVHRISEFGSELVPPVLSDRYGAFRGPVVMRQLTNVISERGAAQPVRDHVDGEFDRFCIGKKKSAAYARRLRLDSVNVETPLESLQLWSIQISAREVVQP